MQKNAIEQDRSESHPISQGARRFSGWQVFVTTAIVIATAMSAYLLFQLSEVLVVLFLGIIFASAIRPAVGWLSRRGLPLSAAIISIYLLVFLVLATLVSYSVPPLIELSTKLFSDGLLMDQLNRLLIRLAFIGWNRFQINLPVMEVPAQLQAMLQQADDTAMEQALPIALSTLSGLGQFIFAFVVGFYWLSTRQSILVWVGRLLPRHQRQEAQTIWLEIEQSLGAWVRGQLILMLLIGVVSWIGLMLLGIPYPLALAVIAGLTEVIPLVGPVIGAIPAILVAFTVSPTSALLVAIFYVLTQQLEANILVPKVMKENVGLNPLVVILALVAGGILNGVVGAVLAIPIAGAFQVILKHLLIERVAREDAMQSLIEAREEHKARQKDSAEENKPQEPPQATSTVSTAGASG